MTTRSRPKLLPKTAPAQPARKPRPRMKPQVDARFLVPHRVPSFTEPVEYHEDLLRTIFYNLVNATHHAAAAFPGIREKAEIRPDWLTAIHCTYFFDKVPDEQFDLGIITGMIHEAVLYFTGTHASVQQLCRRTVQVRADGYAKGPHGKGE